MAIIHSKEIIPPPSFLAHKLSPVDNMPEDSFIRDYGVDTLKAGEECDLHYHDCDEWWVIISGRAKVICGEEKKEAGAGDMVFTKMGEMHQIKAIEDTTLVWLEGPLSGKKRRGHLH